MPVFATRAASLRLNAVVVAEEGRVEGAVRREEALAVSLPAGVAEGG